MVLDCVLENPKWDDNWLVQRYKEESKDRLLTYDIGSGIVYKKERRRDRKDIEFKPDGTVRRKNAYSRKNSRAYHRIISGLMRAQGKLERVSFLTLTSSPNSDFSKINEHFGLLVKRIEYNYGFKMQYVKVKTKEGYGVLHVLFRVDSYRLPKKVKKGSRLPEKMLGFVHKHWLQKNWFEIHGAFMVEIHSLKGKESEREVANYVVGGYLSKQGDYRLSYSFGWIGRRGQNIKDRWGAVQHVYGRKAYVVWDAMLKSGGLSSLKKTKLAFVGENLVLVDSWNRVLKR